MHYAKIQRHVQAVTIPEVLASVVLIVVGLTAVFGMNGESLQILRRAQQTMAASQILQERIEMLRTQSWPTIARGQAAAALWLSPADSSPDLVDANPTETVKVSPAPSPGVPASTSSFYKIIRRTGKPILVQDADLSGEPLLLVEIQIEWVAHHSISTRSVRTIIGRTGLTRSGLFGSAFGRAASGANSGAAQ